MAARTCVRAIRREHDRFWTLTAHPNLNLFAAGHDSGLVIFKLERERPVHILHAPTNTLFYISDGANRRYLRSHDLTTRRDLPLISLRRSTSFGQQPRILSYNPAENAILITTVRTDSSESGSASTSSSLSTQPIPDEGSYDLYRIPKGDSRSNENPDSK